jgi:hypothetical protein
MARLMSTLTQLPSDIAVLINGRPGFVRTLTSADISVLRLRSGSVLVRTAT